jgi:hypothetical protein
MARIGDDFPCDGLGAAAHAALRPAMEHHLSNGRHSQITFYSLLSHLNQNLDMSSSRRAGVLRTFASKM